jgi:hypothetical protein
VKKAFDARARGVPKGNASGRDLAGIFNVVIGRARVVPKVRRTGSFQKIDDNALPANFGTPASERYRTAIRSTLVAIAGLIRLPRSAEP